MLVACGDGDERGTQGEGGLPEAGEAGPLMPRAMLLEPHVCGSCHADHFAEWQSSMHAFAADDPVFLAMNARGQRETDGGLGTFCVNCHAPMAVRDGLTKDGLNLATLPAKYRGVTCFFCHSIDSVDGSHNAAVTVSGDLVMRGEYADPVPNSAHLGKYSPLHDKADTRSATMCGACHDIAVPGQLDGDAGAHIERTFAEWQASAFSAPGGETCAASSCHMVQSATTRPIAQQTGLQTVPPARYYHAHDFPAVDAPLMVGADAAAPEPAGVQALLSNALQGDLCVNTVTGGIRVVLDTPNLGHDFPSGASQDRRFWAEVVAYRGTDVIYQSGVVPFGDPAFDAGADPDLWLLRDCIFDTQGNQVHMFWQAASTDGNELTPQVTFDSMDPRFYAGQKIQYFPRGQNPLAAGVPDRVTLSLWVQPVGLDVLRDLVASGDLDPSIVRAMPKFPVPLGVLLGGDAGSAQLVWTAQDAADGGVQAFAENGMNVTCVGTLPVPTPNLAPAHTMCSP
jgi:hypothetical protein